MVNDNIDIIAEYDKLKTKVLKYIIYKKRTENEIRQKFSQTINEDTLNDIIEELKESGYINDLDYVDRAVCEFMALKNLSIKEIKYKLLAKGIDSYIIEEYISSNLERLNEYEIQSAKNICNHKPLLEQEELKLFLLKKGYNIDNIKIAMEG